MNNENTSIKVKVVTINEFGKEIRRETVASDSVRLVIRQGESFDIRFVIGIY